ncbi:cell division protein ZapE [Nocardia speluncae]|uniref:Cell division protein ZapE n=1 Tax=Nocardia speluncae TaxID=419477 RepID=A0A846XAS4_9NOCA|nr:cell division protein ZapE [Nocardia speluncae]NKY33391.1 cell division protein ZapE [Nocardia speluncae]
MGTHSEFGSVFDNAARNAGFVLDESQRTAAALLGRLGGELAGRRRLFGSPPRGVYLWGPVGRGKSWLVDTFYDTVPVQHKRRIHFHEFFREFHFRYAAHRHGPRAGERAVRDLLGEARLVCFDEFHVHDPGDATILAKVVNALFARRITLVATSNYPPSGLLPNPLFHHLIEPVTAALETALDIIEVAGPHDYRQSAPAPATGFGRGRYLWPGDNAQLAAAGLRIPVPSERRSVAFGTRSVNAMAVHGTEIWFDFTDLCDRPYSTIDYLHLADRYRHWTLSGLPVLATADRDAVQRFANLIDVLCDRQIPLNLIAAAPLRECLSGDHLPPDIHRTASRLALLPGAADTAAAAGRSPGSRGSTPRTPGRL